MGIPKIYYAKGKDQYESKQYDEAIVSLNKSIELDPNYAMAYIRKAQIFDDQNDEVEFKQRILVPSRRSGCNAMEIGGWNFVRRFFCSIEHLF